MRETKFRVWDIKKDCWLDEAVHFVIDRDGIKSIIDYVAGEINISNVCDRYIVMQYTGVNDKNGVEICEGDIVEVVSNVPGTEHLEIKGVVVVEECKCCIEDRLNKKMIYLWNEGVDIEVIDNIYENSILEK